MSAAGWITAIGVVMVLVVLFGVIAVRRDKRDEQERFRRYGTGGSINGPARTDGVPAVLSEGGPVDSFDDGGYVSPDLRAERRTQRAAGAPTGGARHRSRRRDDDRDDATTIGYAGGLFDPVTPADTSGREPGGWSDPGPSTSDSGGSSDSGGGHSSGDSGGGTW